MTKPKKIHSWKLQARIHYLRIPPPHKHVLLALASFYPRIYPSQRHLAYLTGYSTRNIERSLDWLDAHGYFLDRKYRKRLTTVYVLNVDVILIEAEHAEKALKELLAAGLKSKGEPHTGKKRTSLLNRGKRGSFAPLTAGQKAAFPPGKPESRSAHTPVRDDRLSCQVPEVRGDCVSCLPEATRCRPEQTSSICKDTTLSYIGEPPENKENSSPSRPTDHETLACNSGTAPSASSGGLPSVATTPPPPPQAGTTPAIETGLTPFRPDPSAPLPDYDADSLPNNEVVEVTQEMLDDCWELTDEEVG
jgi:hypothetical protein